MTAPDQQPQDAPDDQLVGALSTFLAEAALVGTVALPPALYAMLLRLGFSKRAIQLATRLATAPLGRRTGTTPHTSRTSARIAGTAAAQVADQEPEWRARYLIAAARRLTRDLSLGASPFTALREERRWFDQHRAAGKRRAAAAAAVDKVADESGSNWLRWTLSDKPQTHTRGCLWAAGQVFTRDQPLVFTDDDLPARPQFPGATHPQCLLPGTVVASPSIRATTARWYSGEVVELFTDSGHHLSVTPNHPILTSEGWVAAGLLNERSYVVSTDFPEALTTLVDPDNYQVPALVEDVLRSFGEHRGVLAVPVPVAAEDFHGDGVGSEVAVVRTDGMLRDGVDAAQPQPSLVEEFRRVPERLPVPPLGMRATLFVGELGATHGRMSRLDVAKLLLGRTLAHEEQVGLSLRPALDAAIAKDVSYSGAGGAMQSCKLKFTDSIDVRIANVPSGQAALLDPGSLPSQNASPVRGPMVKQGSALLQSEPKAFVGDIELLRNRQESAISSLVRFDRVREVRQRLSWSGHVYNLESSAGWYVSGNIVSHNCRCTAQPLFPVSGAAPTITS